jgi:hypothetical protein
MYRLIKWTSNLLWLAQTRVYRGFSCGDPDGIVP